MPLLSALSAPVDGVVEAAVVFAGAGGVADPPAAVGVAGPVAVGGTDDAACPTGCAPEAGVDGTAAAGGDAVFRLSWPSSRRMRCSIASSFFKSASFEAGSAAAVASDALGSAPNLAPPFAPPLPPPPLPPPP